MNAYAHALTRLGMTTDAGAALLQVTKKTSEAYAKRASKLPFSVICVLTLIQRHPELLNEVLSMRFKAASPAGDPLLDVPDEGGGDASASAGKIKPHVDRYCAAYSEFLEHCGEGEEF